jgi:hypothetical protein
LSIEEVATLDVGDNGRLFLGMGICREAGVEPLAA